jgi:hypothetical protein
MNENEAETNNINNTNELLLCKIKLIIVHSYMYNT